MKTELEEMVAEAKVARSIVGKLCSEGRYPKMSIPLQESDEDRVLCRACESVTKLVGMIESRDAEIHTRYAPVMEALEAFAESDISDIRMSMIFNARSALASIKEKL